MRHTEQEIRETLEEGKGANIAELCRKKKISGATFYTWRSRYSSAPRNLLEENRKLKLLVAEQALRLMN